jgi:hypothetical protein
LKQLFEKALFQTDGRTDEISMKMPNNKTGFGNFIIKLLLKGKII